MEDLRRSIKIDEVTNWPKVRTKGMKGRVESFEDALVLLEKNWGEDVPANILVDMMMLHAMDRAMQLHGDDAESIIKGLWNVCKIKKG